MRIQTKQELRDRIAELEKQLAVSKWQVQWDSKYATHLQESGKYHLESADTYKIQAKRATIAAYALLVTLVVIVVMGVIWE